MQLRRLALPGLLVTLSALLGVAGPVAPCDPASGDFCGLPRAEDLVQVPGTDWLVVSSDTHDAPLQFIDARSRRRVAVTLPFTLRDGARRGDADCPGPPTRWRAGGNDLKRVDGRLELAVLNRVEPGAAVRDGDERVELFEVRVGRDGPAARWTGCVPIPARWSLNDVALAPDGALYGSHQFDRPRSPEEAAATRQKWLSGVATGLAVEWRPGAQWRAVPGTEVSFANGIAVSQDGRTLAVAGTYSAALLLVDRSNGTVRRVPLPHTPDNVTALAGGRFLSAGHTGVPVTGVDPCRDPKAVPCGFPFAIAEVGREPTARVVYEHDGSRIPGASVAVPLDGRLYLGSFFGDRISVVDLPPGRLAR